MNGKLETLDEVPSRAKIRSERFKPHRCNSVGTEPIRIDTKKFHSAIYMTKPAWKMPTNQRRKRHYEKQHEFAIRRQLACKFPGQGRSILDKGPDAFFWEKDLYTIRWLGRTDDVIERQLFGTIDTMGKRAIDAWLAEDYDTIHETYWHVYEFMDALRLRTPKGLRFVQEITRKRTQLDLMVAMQELRRMHCVMWAEGCLEIARAPKGSAGFIFSDHPVTLFNRYVFPRDPDIPPGQDPHLHWQGTQTIFPFDRERLYILTHAEFANSPGPRKARKPRTNSRYFDPGTPMVRYDECIRTRTLTEQQVHEVNYIIKARAHRYIAGRTEDDLFPEHHLKTTAWHQLGKFLLPPKHKLSKQVGHTIVRFKDGSYHFQDQFGRRPASRAEYEREVKRAEERETTFRRVLSKHRAERGEPPPVFEDENQS